MTTKVLTPDQAADYLGVSGVQLYRWRKSGNGPPFMPWGKRTIRYRVSDLDTWLEQQRTANNTAQAATILKQSA